MANNTNRTGRVFKEIMGNRDIKRVVGSETKQRVFVENLEKAGINKKFDHVSTSKREAFLKSIKGSHIFEGSERRTIIENLSGKKSEPVSHDNKSKGSFGDERKKIYDDVMNKRKGLVKGESLDVKNKKENYQGREESKVLYFGKNKDGMRKIESTLGQSNEASDSRIASGSADSIQAAIKRIQEQ